MQKNLEKNQSSKYNQNQTQEYFLIWKDLIQHKLIYQKNNLSVNILIKKNNIN